MEIISVNGGRLQFSSQNIMLYNRDKDALLRVVRAARALGEYVELPEDVTGWMSKYRWCPYCGYKSSDGHWKDCEMLELIEALKEVEHLL